MATEDTREGNPAHPAGQHPDLPPPAGTTGAIGWLRENLFAGPANTIGTIVTAVVLYVLLVPLIQWSITDSVISGSDRHGCDIGRFAANIGNAYNDFSPENLALDPNREGLDPETARLWAARQKRAEVDLTTVGSMLGNFDNTYQTMVREGTVPADLLAIVDEVRPLELQPALLQAIQERDLPAVNDIVNELQLLIAWGQSRDGACWVVIKERVLIFMMGFYPREEAWRLIVAAVLLVGAVAPLLFDKMPFRRPLLLVTVTFPLTGFWFVVGDFPTMIYCWIAFAIYWLDPNRIRGPTIAAALVLLNLLYYFGFFELGLFTWIESFVLGLFGLEFTFSSLFGFKYLDFEYVPTGEWGGLLATMVNGVVGITASLPIGIVLALGRRSNMPIIRALCTAFIETVRGVPLITVLFMAALMLPLFLPEGVSFDKFLRALIGVALFSSAYMAEVVRGGLQAIPKGQYEAADAMGLTYWRSMRLIVLPQALKIQIPAIVNSFIGLYKDTTLLSIIGILDVLLVATQTNTRGEWVGFSSETYFFAGFIFVIFCFGMSRYSIFLERKLHTGHRS